MAAEPPGATGLPGLLPPSHFQPRRVSPSAAVARSEAEQEAERGRSPRLGAELETERGRSRELGAELEAERRRSQRLEAELEAERGRSRQLEAELEAERRWSLRLGAELTRGRSPELEALKGCGQEPGAELEAEGRGLALGAELEEEPEQGPLLRARVAALSRILELQELELSAAAPAGPPWRRLLGRWRAQVFGLLLQRRLRERRQRHQVAALEAAVASSGRRATRLELRLQEAAAEGERRRRQEQALAAEVTGQRRRAEEAEEALGDLLEATRRLARLLSGHQDAVVAATRRLDGFGHRLERAGRSLRRLRGRMTLARPWWHLVGDRASPEVTGGAGAERSLVVPAWVTRDKVAPEEATRDKVTPEQVTPEAVTRDRGTRGWVLLGPQLQAAPHGDQLPPPDRGALGTLVRELRALGAAILKDGDVPVTSPS